MTSSNRSRARRVTYPARGPRLRFEAVEDRRLLSVAPAGSEFLVNTYTTDGQADPAVAMDADGDFVVAWESYGQDGRGRGIYAQRYSNTTPATVTDVTLGSFIVEFSRNVSTEGGSSGAGSATNPANYQLFQGLTDISGSITGITYAYNPATAHFEATITTSPPLSGGSYQLIVSDNVQSEHGQPLDGDGDGVPGGDADEPFEVPSSSVEGRFVFYNDSEVAQVMVSPRFSSDGPLAIRSRPDTVLIEVPLAEVPPQTWGTTSIWQYLDRH